MESDTKAKLPANLDTVASLLLYGVEGTCETLTTNGLFITDDKKASVMHQGDWCAALSAYVCPVSQRRWIQDRQNFISIFNRNTGLILGGGNTKLQPLWSTFTVGDTQLLKQRTGDQTPDFLPGKGLLHVPTAAKLDTSGHALSLEYGDTSCGVVLDIADTNSVRLNYHVAHTGSLQPIEAHVTLLPSLGTTWRTASGRSGKLDDASLNLTAADIGEWFEHHDCRISIPPGSNLRWPVLPHNPYRKDGHADTGEGRIVLTLPFTENVNKQTIVVTMTK